MKQNTRTYARSSITATLDTIKKLGWRELTEKELTEARLIERVGKAPREIFPSICLAYPGTKRFKAYLYTTIDPVTKNVSPIGKDKAKLIIIDEEIPATENNRVFSMPGIQRRKYFLNRLVSWAKIGAVAIQHSPLCPERTCLERMDCAKDNGREVRGLFIPHIHRCDRVENHHHGRPIILKWHEPLLEHLQLAERKLLINYFKDRDRHNAKMTEAGKPLGQAKARRRRHPKGNPS